MAGMSKSSLLLLVLCIIGLAQCQKNRTVEDKNEKTRAETVTDVPDSKSVEDNSTKLADIKSNARLDSSDNSSSSSSSSGSGSSSSSSSSSSSNSNKSATMWVSGSTECTCIRELTALKRDLRAEITQRLALQTVLDSYVTELYELRNVVEDIIAINNDTANSNSADSNSSGNSDNNNVTKLRAPAINAAAASGNPSVAFSAKLSYNRELKPLDTVIFDTVLTNDGNAYNADTGKFTAVVTGIHMFHSTILSGYNTKVETAIIVNDKEVARIYSGAHDAHGSGSNMAIVDLRSGDSVWVRLLYQGGNHVHGYYSTFSGALLRPADP